MPRAMQGTAALFVPEKRNLPVLRDAVQKCHGCDLYRHATQAVFGEIEADNTPSGSQLTIMMIGEQPGDREDREGHPFVGPSGKLLDACLQDAGIDRRMVYVTNAVKHFKWEPRGQIRLHKKPNMKEIQACRPWLDAEIETVQPKLIVCLGATAAQTLLGAKFRITESHGEVQEAGGLPPVIATLHPSAILHARTAKDREQNRQTLIDDLHLAHKFINRSRPK
jgi:uracil-DNA glycosylase family protein